MPIGMVVMRWNERVGAELVAKYPEEVNISDKTLMQIYSTHEYTGEAGMISAMIGALNVASYYTGAEKGYYILLLLNADEDADAYEEGLADISRIILNNLEGDAFQKLVPSLFQRVSIYPSLNPEQKLAMVYFDDTKRMVFSRLRDEGAVTKSELQVWLKDQYRGGFVDIESTLNSLIKEELVKAVSVKGMPSELVYLIKDILIARAPADALYRDGSSRGLPANLVETYRQEVLSFFSYYEISDEDNLLLLKVLLDGPTYETLKLMREAFVTRDDLEKLKKKGVDDVDAVLRILWDAKMLAIMRDAQSNEYYGLKTDVVVEKFLPQYMVDTIRQHYRTKAKANIVLLEYLNVLQESFLAAKK